MNRKEFFDLHAEKWDSFIDQNLLNRINTIIIPLFCIKKEESILDIGAGTGILLPYLREKTGRNGRITALDYSSLMLEKAKQKFGDEFEYFCASAEKIPCDIESFDRAICFAVFPHFPDKQKVLYEIRRVLKKGGSLNIAHADAPENINKCHTSVGGPVSHDHMPDNKKITTLLSETGFSDIQIIEGSHYHFVSAVKK